ncbi:MAG: MarC family protein [Bacteroidales bacterium]|jgi:multiple antibiotic resistance protein|nr:MarC family protein [Bacteroidales bacterium]
MSFSFKEIISAFIVLFAIIDITGSIPIIIDLRSKGAKISPLRVSLISFVILVAFLYAGEGLLSLFGVEINSFAVAGAIIIFIYGMEMILGREIINNDGPASAANAVPIIFPLIAGAGVLTTLISMRAEYAIQNIIVAIALNMVVVYFVLKYVDWVERVLGPTVIYILRKIFGIILIAIAVKLFTTNLASMI